MAPNVPVDFKQGELMACYICDKTDWHEVMYEKDGKQVPIHADGRVAVCKNCGNAAHLVPLQSEEQIKEFYRKEYRPPPTVSNLLTTTHKQNYIAAFLREFLKGKKGLVCGDVGCATGYFPAFLRSLGHRATGCEYTLTYRRFAEHYYGIPITEELEPKHKYDLISMYHVLEHVTEPDKKLAKYAGMLAEGGHLLVSTPRWFSDLDEASGTGVASFEHLFHKNHINLFSERSLKNLFAKLGLVIVKEDQLTYGQTYLLRLASPSELAVEVVFEDPDKIAGTMREQRRAIELFVAGDAKAALDAYRKFPDAWLRMIFAIAGKEPEKQDDLFAEVFQLMPQNLKMRRALATLLYQRGEIKKALEIYIELQQYKPNEDDHMYMGYCYSQLGNHKAAIQCFLIAAQMDPRKWVEAQNWACRSASSMPTWDEQAMQQLQVEMLRQSAGKVQIQVKDLAMDAPEVAALRGAASAEAAA